MAFCASCGAPMEGRFCAKCGAMAGAAAPAAAPAPGAGGAAGAQPVPAASTGMSTNGASALCYVLGLITGILFLVLEPYNKNRTVRFHAFQSIFLNVAWIAIWIGLTIVSIVLTSIMSLLGLVVGLLHLVAGLGFFALWIFMIFKAYQGAMVKLPIIGPLAEKQAQS